MSSTEQLSHNVSLVDFPKTCVLKVNNWVKWGILASIVCGVSRAAFLDLFGLQNIMTYPQRNPAYDRLVPPYDRPVPGYDRQVSSLHWTTFCNSISGEA
ncbi:unnamed protein product [Bemisia tabaci]|uniref:Uncharacterized protein n=1 Tax=Bemisia tabaci TaxID=7038 RepID=A0A9P0F4X1_BEMTA|nr:unnamed protein product [Bemisia tabaci]